MTHIAYSFDEHFQLGVAVTNVANRQVITGPDAFDSLLYNQLLYTKPRMNNRQLQ
jgi:hypothetical protein